MPIITIPGDEIQDWNSFHDVFARVLGFPDYYGRNMDAWIDCISGADENDGMLNLVVEDDDVLTLQVENVVSFRERCAEQYDALVECSAFVNWRRIERGHRPIVALSYYA